MTSGARPLLNPHPSVKTLSAPSPNSAAELSCSSAARSYSAALRRSPPLSAARIYTPRVRVSVQWGKSESKRKLRKL
ncbi:hypothetical protein J5N97_026227 [Dioscorea zingiberensis]|uniref:Uncharacterized protein n=1 Tax=Dioscorea zingiberensis TaxID=325984 RepID=A0A9D5H6A9_9LILI|nr:hypothetical protein J5N97_026227 [Dioscorea zingiberensis]